MRAQFFPRTRLMACAAAVGAVFGATCLPAQAGPAEDGLVAFSKFFPAFVAHNQLEVAAMFAPDALFYGTQSPELVTSPEGVLQYFTRALNRPDTTLATPLKMSAVALSDHIVLVSGMWGVERTLDGKTTAGSPLRVSAVLQKRDDRWLVVQFHNSPRPTTPVLTARSMSPVPQPTEVPVVPAATR